MPVGDLRRRLRHNTPALWAEIDALVSDWLEGLIASLGSDHPREFRPKQVNDPVWGTIELLPWEVALLDTPLLQRMRGVRQLGLAQLVFPGAGHSRLEHIIGVIGAIEELLRAVSRQIERWNLDNTSNPLPIVAGKDRYALRLAALFHDIGHGPFSHALEPVLEVSFGLLGAAAAAVPGESNWRQDIKTVQNELKSSYALNGIPVVSETIAVMMVLSEPVFRVLGNDRLFTERGRATDELQEVLVAAIIGAVEGPGASYLSALISSQIDADKLDYLPRDAHHAGLDIGFDTDRLLSRLEVLHVRDDNVDASATELRARAARSPDKAFHQIGIAASGFGSFEQMLIGRTFLFDRLYHHHKVRAAEAMAQRLVLVAERDRGRRFNLVELFLNVGDDTLLRIFAGEITHPKIIIETTRCAALARGILDRELHHRAFAFRGRFIASPPGLSSESAEPNRQTMWRRIVKDLDGLPARFDIGQEIYDVALRCTRALAEAGIDPPEMTGYKKTLETIGPEQIIVDLPALKADAI